MSRCFPFPPPGYEKKEISVQEDLLAKEKHREKKNKKEKKEKEKRDGKERSKDKHKEKKDKKEKKRDKDKSRTSADEFDKQKESHNGGNLGDHGRKTDEFNHSKCTVELAKRINDGEKVAPSRMVESFSVAAQRSTNGLGAATVPLMESVASSHENLSSVGISKRIADTGREPVRVADTSRELVNLPSTSHKVGSIASANLLRKETSGLLGQTLDYTAPRRDGASTSPVGKPEGFVRGGSEGFSLANGVEVEKYKINKVASTHGSTTQKTINGMAKPANSPSNLVQKAVNAICFSTKTEDRRVNTFTTIHILTEQKGVNKMVRSADNGPNKATEEKEKKRDREAHGGKRRHDEKTRDQKKKDKEKNKNKNKEEEKEKEKAKTSDEGEHKHKKPVVEPKDGRKSDRIDNLDVKPSTTLQSVNSTSYHTDEKTKKRKEFEINGYRHESDIRPNKIQRTIPSPHHHLENGRKLELSHVKPFSSVMKPELLKIKDEGQTNLDDKCMGNIIVEAGLRHPVAISTNTCSEVSLKPPRPDAKHLNPQVSLKPPHPDAKYLSEIYYVPKMDQWPDYDSQEWLLSGSKVLQKQQHMLEADETPIVWAEALRIETGDVLALPYVIPL